MYRRYNQRGQGIKRCCFCRQPGTANNPLKRNAIDRSKYGHTAYTTDIYYHPTPTRHYPADAEAAA